jgi:hypothetical protein
MSKITLAHPLTFARCVRHLRLVVSRLILTGENGT